MAAAGEGGTRVDTDHAVHGSRWRARGLQRADTPAQVAHLTPLAHACDAGVEWGTAALVAFSVLAFGGLLYWAPYVIVLTAAALAALWCVRLLAAPVHVAPWCGTVAARWGGVLVVLLILPLVPLPPALVRAIAPRVHALYSQALPGWPARPPFAELSPRVDLTGPPLGVWRPLALVPYDTVTSLWTGAAYATVGALVAFYPWRHAAAVVTRLTLVLIGVGTFEALYGMLQQSDPAPSIFGLPCSSGICLGTYVNPDHYAGLLEMVFPLVLARAVTWFWKYRRHHVPSARTDNWRPRLAHTLEALYDPAIGRAVSFSCIALLLGVAMAISGCRSALAATLLSVLLLQRYVPRRQPHPVRLSATVLAIVVVAAGFWATFPRISQKFATHDLDSEVRLTGTRALIAADTLGMVRDFPLLGVGVGNFSSVFPSYRARTVRFSMDVEHAHNDYLEWLAEVGGPATALACGLLLWLGVRVIRALRHAGDVTSDAMVRWGSATGALALLLHSWTDFNLHVPANALVFSVLLGALLRLTVVGRTAEEHRVRAVLPLAVCVVIVVAIASNWQRWAIAAFVQRAQSDTLSVLEEAAAAAPAAPHLQDALGRRLIVMDGAAAPRSAAARAFIRALKAAPLNPRALLQLASAIDPLGDRTVSDVDAPRGRSVDLVTRATALAAYEPTVQLDIAEWYLARWAAFDAATRTHAAQQVQAMLAATARAPYVMQRRYGILNTYDRVTNGAQTGTATHS